jgi:hypothetical protein
MQATTDTKELQIKPHTLSTKRKMLPLIKHPAWDYTEAHKSASATF